MRQMNAQARKENAATAHVQTSAAIADEPRRFLFTIAAENVRARSFPELLKALLDRGYSQADVFRMIRDAVITPFESVTTR